MICVKKSVDFVRECLPRSVTMPRPGRFLAAACLAAMVLSGTPVMAQLTPIAIDDTLSAQQDLFGTVSVLQNDELGDYGTAEDPNYFAPWSVEIVLQPQHGVLTVDPQTGDVLYVPDAGYFGSDGFAYQFSDTHGRVSNAGFVSIDVVRINKAPVLSNFTGRNVEGNRWVFTGTVSDDVMIGLTISFGGILAGQQASVASDGTFTFEITIDPNNHGLVSAVAQDSDAALSDISDYNVT